MRQYSRVLAAMGLKPYLLLCRHDLTSPLRADTAELTSKYINVPRLRRQDE
jgi:hypothetical protein